MHHVQPGSAAYRACAFPPGCKIDSVQGVQTASSDTAAGLIAPLAPGQLAELVVDYTMTMQAHLLSPLVKEAHGENIEINKRKMDPTVDVLSVECRV